MYRIQNQASHLVMSQTTGAPPTFLGTLFGGWLVFTKRLFDKYIVSVQSFPSFVLDYPFPSQSWTIRKN